MTTDDATATVRDRAPDQADRPVEAPERWLPQPRRHAGDRLAGRERD